MSAKERYVHNFETMKQGNVLGGALSTGMGAAFTGEPRRCAKLGQSRNFGS